MAAMPPPDELFAARFACPCGWSGVGRDAVVFIDDVVRCPECEGPLVTEELAGDYRDPARAEIFLGDDFAKGFDP